jgi:hypothetical protein
VLVEKMLSMKEQTFMKRHRDNPSRDTAAAPEVYGCFAAEWQIVHVPESVEGGYAAHMKRSAGKSLQSEDQPVSVDGLRGSGEHSARQRLEPTALYILSNELP